MQTEKSYQGLILGILIGVMLSGIVVGTGLRLRLVMPATIKPIEADTSSMANVLPAIDAAVKQHTEQISALVNAVNLVAKNAQSADVNNASELVILNKALASYVGDKKWNKYRAEAQQELVAQLKKQQEDAQK